METDHIVKLLSGDDMRGKFRTFISQGLIPQPLLATLQGAQLDLIQGMLFSLQIVVESILFQDLLAHIL